METNQGYVFLFCSGASGVPTDTSVFISAAFQRLVARFLTRFEGRERSAAPRVPKRDRSYFDAATGSYL